jgi:hypothetical protein
MIERWRRSESSMVSDRQGSRPRIDDVRGHTYLGVGERVAPLEVVEGEKFEGYQNNDADTWERSCECPESGSGGGLGLGEIFGGGAMGEDQKP